MEKNGSKSATSHKPYVAVYKSQKRLLIFLWTKKQFVTSCKLIIYYYIFFKTVSKKLLCNVDNNNKIIINNEIAIVF